MWLVRLEVMNAGQRVLNQNLRDHVGSSMPLINNDLNASFYHCRVWRLVVVVEIQPSSIQTEQHIAPDRRLEVCVWRLWTLSDDTPDHFVSVATA
jgi:hypothetical protein